MALDIVLVAAILYSLYVLIRGTRAIRILFGILILGVLYILAQLLNLTALNFLLQSVFAVTLVAIPVVFQPELRAALERLGRGDLVRSLWAPASAKTQAMSGELASAIRELARTQTGALIVLERGMGIKDLTDSGVALDARVSIELILTIFQPGTPLHDGAIVIHGDRIVAASVFLPLASDTDDHSLGTRHRAAQGLAKETDAVVVVVSEETGRISIAHHRELDIVTPRQLEGRLRLLLSIPGRS